MYTEGRAALLDAGGDAVSGVEEEILAFMEAVCPAERIFRRSDLDRFGPASDVDRALDHLARERRVGSPAEDIWFPIRYVAGFDYPLPYASLRKLTLSLLQREGVPTCVSRQERDYFRFRETKGREGVWGVPNFEAIGVEEPVHLSLLWNGGGAYTEYQGDLMEFSTDFGFTATEIHDPQKLCRRAEQLDLAPYRVEKDVRVNAVLQGMGLAPWPEDGCLLFAGGTGLVKAWRLSARFSEDIDFWYLGQTFPPDLSANTQQRVHAHLLHCLQQWVLPRIPGSSINGPLSQLRDAVPVQRVFLEYPSVVEPGRSETLKVEVMFAKSVPHWLSRSVESFPAMTSETSVLIPQYPCVATWATMLGKLHALSLMHPGRNHQDMRHVHDLGAWRVANNPSFHPLMIQQALSEVRVSTLLDGLPATLAALANDDVCRRDYAQYVSDMYPSNHRGNAPGLDMAVDFIRRLWNDMCESDWEHPRYAPAPVPLPVESEFKNNRQGGLDPAKEQALRQASEARPDAEEIQRYGESWRNRPTGTW